MVRRCMRFFLGCVCVGAVLALGCDDIDGTSGSASDVKGTLVDVHIVESGEVSHPAEPANFQIAAIYTAPDGTLKEIQASIAKDGSFVIPKVPTGPYTLRFLEFVGASALPPRYVVNAPREIDLGRVYVGRPDAEAIETEPTDLGISATNLLPWIAGDVLEIFSTGSGAAGALLPTTGAYPNTGATGLDKYRVDASKLPSAKLVDGSKGDKAVITHLANDPNATTAYQSIRRILEVPSFTQVDGTPSLVSGAFTDVPQKMFSININTPSFAFHGPAVHPLTQVAGKSVRLISEPGNERATASVTPNLLICNAAQGAALPDSFSYGNPFPGEWSEIVSTEIAFAMTHLAPTGIEKATILAIGQSGPLSSFASPATPLLTPALDLKVNGMAATDTLTGIGYSPTLSFSPPQIGVPAVYIVAVRRLDPGGSTTRTSAIFSTTETTLRIPEGLLDFGYYYYFRVTVRSNFDAAHPFKSGTTNAYASAVTGVVTP